MMRAEHRDLKITVNGRYRAHQITGVQRYAHEIVARLPDSQFDVLAPKSGKGARGHLWEQTTLAAASRGRLLWSPCGNGPAFYKRQVVTFHDIFPLEHPEWYSAQYARWYSSLLPRLANSAVALIAVSQYTKSRIVKLLGRNPDEIKVIPNGLTTGCARVGSDKIEAAAKALQLPSRNYILTLSSLEKRKNLRTTLAAWAQIHSELPSDTWLVLAGKAAEKAVYGEQQIPVDLPRVHFTGYVPEEHLSGLYSGASLFVFPSLAEGFGLPLLEAMACGVRSITADNSSLPEVGGDTVRYVDALDEVALGQAILQELAAYDGTPYSPAMERSKLFSWNEASTETWALLEAANLAQDEIYAFRRPYEYQKKRVLNTKKDEVAPVALVHDWLTGMRGGEKVLELFCQHYPSAPLWTLLHCNGSVHKTIEARTIHSSLLQHLPMARKFYRNYLPFFPAFAELNKANATELIVSTSHAVAKAMVKRSSKGRPYHVCYIHTPMRYVWDMFDEYFGPDRVGSSTLRAIFRVIAHLLQWYDKATIGRVDLFIANSRFVAERVRRIYGREALVIAPPVDTERFLTMPREAEDWYLVVSAMVPYKRVDHAIRACSALGRSLKLVGKGPETASLKRLAEELDADAEFVGFVSDEELGHYYRRARALLFPGVEDFGIVPVEAIACGCPVIALGIGGILDSMTELTSVLYQTSSAEGLQAAMQKFEMQEADFRETDLRQQALHFSKAEFLPRFDLALNTAKQIAGQTETTAGPIVLRPDSNSSVSILEMT